MATFRLLHASDLHIALKPERVGLLDTPTAGLRFPRDLKRIGRTSSYSPDLLDGLIEFVYDRGDRFDAVLLSGDLATTGKSQDLQQARDCIDGDSQGLWYTSPPSGRSVIASHRSLKSAGKRLLLLPGNHDRYDSTFPFFVPGGTLFDDVRYFGKYWKAGQGVQTWISPFKEGVRLGLVSADLSLRSGDQWADPLGSYGQGNVYADIIHGLETLTEDLRTDTLGLLWVVHFPPAYPGIDPVLRLLDEEVLIEAASRQRISHILAGHTHSPRAYSAESSAGTKIEILCAGTAAQGVAPWGNFIHELEIEVDAKGIASISFQTFQWYEEVGGVGRGAEGQWIPVSCPVANRPDALLRP